MFTSFHNVINNIPETIKENKKTVSQPVIGVLPAYFPLELVDAAGGYPVQLWGNNLPIEKADTYLQSFCCSVARSMLELEMRGSAEMVNAYAFTSLCDTLINLREVYRRLFSKPTIELSIPITQTDSARRTYLESIIQTILKDLERITDSKITPESLTKASESYGRTRDLQKELYRFRRDHPGFIKNVDFYSTLKAGFFLPKEEYNAMLEELLNELKAQNPPEGKRIRILPTGMVFDPMFIHQLLDDLKMDVIDDDFANGWRTVSKKALDTNDLVEGITEYMFNPTPCCCLYHPDSDRHNYLTEKAKACKADGVLFWYVNFCEPDAFDKPQLMEHLKQEGIPCAAIDIDLTMTNFDAIKTRITAFREMLEG